MQVNKSKLRIFVWHRFYNYIDLNDYIEKRREAFEAVAPLPHTKHGGCVLLWTANTGWGSPKVNWSSTAKAIAEHTKQWTKLLADFAALCQEVRRARFFAHDRRFLSPERRRVDLIAGVTNEHGAKAALLTAEPVIREGPARPLGPA
jgi:hypothetical protein